MQSPAQATHRITVAAVQDVVGAHFGLTKGQLLSRDRRRSIARPRQIAMYLAKTMTQQSYPNLGRRFGSRDHTTVMHAVRRVAALRDTDLGVAILIDSFALEIATAESAVHAQNVMNPSDLPVQ